MNAVKTNSITAEQRFSADVMLDKDFLLLPSGCVFTEEQIKDLSDWGFEEVYTSGKTITVASAPQAVSARQQIIVKKSFFINMLILPS